MSPSDRPQLPLPNVDRDAPEGAARVSTLPRDRKVYVNRSLRMDRVEWVGFDMDYTLAIYKQDEIDRLSMEATVKKLVERGYPPVLQEARFDTSYAIRGVLIDKKLGHILKMDRYKYVGRAWHGTRELSRDERHALYHQRKIRVTAQRYHWIDTLYALPEAALYAGAVDLLDRYGLHVEYGQLFEDIRECIDEAHRDGSIVDVIADDLPRFVARDPALAPTLHKLRSAGKKLFVLTNSRWEYTEKMMTFLLGGALPEYTSWRQYFDVVSVAAAKPAFFTEKRPILERVLDEGRSGTRPAYSLERGKVYEGGNLKDFERLLNAFGDRILYVGDHIYGDILRSKKDSAWRTALIVQEMTAEFDAMARTEDDVARLDDLAQRRESLEDELRYSQSRLRALLRAARAGRDGDPAAQGEITRSMEGIRATLRALDVEYRALERSVDDAFHPYWGSLFKQGVELSSFGDQVEGYACLYTSRVSNLLAYSTLQHYRSPRDLMPHELG
ncbi:MAG: HAD-IG family 5'-nucleotidase [Polyangiales bacterium]